MKTRYRSTVTIVIAIVAAFVGAAIAQFVVPEKQGGEPTLLEAIRPSLGLSQEQNARLHKMQTLHEAQTRRLEAKIKEQNLQISSAIDKDHRPSPAVLRAIREAQVTINELQRQDVIYLLDARTILNEQQKGHFDKMVQRALTEQR